MSHYEIDYNAMPEAEAKNRVFKDVRSWLGDKNYYELVTTLKASKRCNTNLLFFVVGMKGIQGYAAQILIEHFTQRTIDTADTIQ